MVHYVSAAAAQYGCKPDCCRCDRDALCGAGKTGGGLTRAAAGGRAAAQARAAYSAGLPPRYTDGAHAAALGAARDAFWAAAAGPAAGAAAAALERACDAEWARRRRCEALSLTGRPCRLAPHGPDVAHISGARILAASEDGTTRWRPLLICASSSCAQMTPCRSPLPGT